MYQSTMVSLHRHDYEPMGRGGEVSVTLRAKKNLLKKLDNKRRNGLRFVVQGIEDLLISK